MAMRACDRKIFVDIIDKLFEKNIKNIHEIDWIINMKNRGNSYIGLFKT